MGWMGRSVGFRNQKGERDNINPIVACSMGRTRLEAHPGGKYLLRIMNLNLTCGGKNIEPGSSEKVEGRESVRTTRSNGTEGDLSSCGLSYQRPPRKGSF